MKKFTLKEFTANTKANGLSSAIELYIEHSHRKAIATLVDEVGVKTIKEFCKFNFDEYEMSFGKLLALTNLQSKLNKMMKKEKVAKATPVKVVAKKKKTKAVTKIKTAKQTMKDKFIQQYKVVTQYSQNLMQDTYIVVYRGKELKRYINETLANNYIEQEVLIRLNEKAVKEPAKIKGINKELKAEFEIA